MWIGIIMRNYFASAFRKVWYPSVLEYSAQLAGNDRACSSICLKDRPGWLSSILIEENWNFLKLMYVCILLSNTFVNYYNWWYVCSRSSLANIFILALTGFKMKYTKQHFQRNVGIAELIILDTISMTY